MERPPVFREGAVQADAYTLRIEQERIAEWMQSYAGPGYGPGGSHKLLDDAVYNERTILRSPASGLREMRLEHAAVEPYRDLVDEVQGAVGDGGTTSLLLATELMLAAYKANHEGAVWPAILDGLGLARRQSLATLQGLRKKSSAADALEATGPSGWAGAIVMGLEGREHVDLSTVDLRPSPVTEPTWAEGVFIEPQENPRGAAVTGRVMLVTKGARTGLSHEWASHVIREPQHMELASDSREAHFADVIARIQDLGVVFLATSEGIDDRLGFRLVSRGIIVQDEVPDDLMRRLERATGARLAATAETATSDELGQATVRCNAKRLGGWSVQGAGDAWTLHLPKSTHALNEATKDEAERLLRAAGAVMENPGSLPGGGAWQAAIHDSLMGAVDAAPGHTSYGVQAAADAFDAVRSHLVRNAGRDPIDTRVLAKVKDPYACMHHAVAAAFEAVHMMLRLDGRFEKKQSDPTMLRGLQQASHTARQNNDVPPWM